MGKEKKKEGSSIGKTEKWHVYMISCADGTIYTGITNDVELRLAKHNSGKGARYTRSRTPVTLLASWICKNKSEAAKMEYQYKQLSRKEKEELISRKKKKRS
jgi:putative endonuclease